MVEADTNKRCGTMLLITIDEGAASSACTPRCSGCNKLTVSNRPASGAQNFSAYAAKAECMRMPRTWQALEPFAGRNDVPTLRCKLKQPLLKAPTVPYNHMDISFVIGAHAMPLPAHTECWLLDSCLQADLALPTLQCEFAAHTSAAAEAT
jgi:hypothetical protein